MVHIDENLRN